MDRGEQRGARCYSFLKPSLTAPRARPGQSRGPRLRTVMRCEERRAGQMDDPCGCVSISGRVGQPDRPMQGTVALMGTCFLKCRPVLAVGSCRAVGLRCLCLQALPAVSNARGSLPAITLPSRCHQSAIIPLLLMPPLGAAARGVCGPSPRGNCWHLMLAAVPPAGAEPRVSSVNIESTTASTGTRLLDAAGSGPESSGSQRAAMRRRAKTGVAPGSSAQNMCDRAVKVHHETYNGRPSGLYKYEPVTRKFVDDELGASSVVEGLRRVSVKVVRQLWDPWLGGDNSALCKASPRPDHSHKSVSARKNDSAEEMPRPVGRPQCQALWGQGHHSTDQLQEATGVCFF